MFMELVAYVLYPLTFVAAAVVIGRLLNEIMNYYLR